MFDAWRGIRRFKKLTADQRNIVIYAESGHDWHHFDSIVHRLCGGEAGEPARELCYLTSDRNDPCFASAATSSGQLHCFYIGDGMLRTWLFQTLQADLLLLTVMDLHNFQLKRSLHPVHYLYLFHSPGSTHMVDHANSYDHYDSLLCVGPHHVAEIRRREQLAGLPAKNLIEHGYERIERLVVQAERYRAQHSPEPGSPPTILLAPTWGEQSTLNLCGDTLLHELLEAGYRVILRPHYETVKRSPQLIEHLRHKYGQHPDFDYVDRMGESDSLFSSDLLICDWSAMAIEYGLALQKPVLFIDVPPRVRNPEWRQWELQPMEYESREQLGAVIAPEELEKIPALVSQLLKEPEQMRQQLQQARERYLFNFGRSVETACEAITQLADRQAEQRRSS